MHQDLHLRVTLRMSDPEQQLKSNHHDAGSTNAYALEQFVRSISLQGRRAHAGARAHRLHQAASKVRRGSATELEEALWLLE